MIVLKRYVMYVSLVNKATEIRSLFTGLNSNEEGDLFWPRRARKKMQPACTSQAPAPATVLRRRGLSLYPRGGPAGKLA